MSLDFPTRGTHTMPRLVAAVCWLVLAACAHADDWPGWRGPTGMGHTREKDLPLTWNGKDGTNVLWKAPLIEGDDKAKLDHNQSSPVVVGERVFVTLSYWPSGKTNKD